MPENPEITRRRTFLQTCIAALAAAVGLEVIPRKSPAADGLPDLPKETFQFFYRRQFMMNNGNSPGKIPKRPDKIISHGQVYDRPDGPKLGQFHTTCLCPETTLGVDHSCSPGTIEFLNLTLPAGTLFGICDPSDVTGGKVYAIIGATGKYSGVKGSYLLQPDQTAGPETGTIKFYLFSMKEEVIYGCRYVS